MARRDAGIDERWGQGRIGRLVRAITTEPQSTRAWATGALGEEKLAAALAGVHELRILHDRKVPRTRGNIDHIVIAPAGIFVVDAKRYKGLIRVRNRGGFFRSDFRLYVGRRDRSSLADALEWQVEVVADCLERAGVDPLPPITPVLCFVAGDWPLIDRPSRFEGVRLESERSMKKLVSRSGELNPSMIERLTSTLAAALPSK